MEHVIATAFGVGGATMIGALIGLLIKNPSHKFSDIILSFASGIMLCAAIIGLIIPSYDADNKISIFLTILGIFVGATFLYLIDKLVPHFHKIDGNDLEPHPTTRSNKIILFVIAIAIHNFPEGLAAGVSFGSDNLSHALSIALGIALQNIPEGMVIIAPLLATGISKKKTILIALATGFVEVIGTFLGYFLITITTFILPFALAFAGGTMLYIISDEMIPETHAHGNEMVSTYSLLIGFAFMLLFNFFIG